MASIKNSASTNITKIGLAVLSIILVFIITGCGNEEKPEPEKQAEPEIVKNEYNLIVDSLEIVTGKIGFGDSFGKLANKYGIGFSKVQKIQKKYNDLFDIGKVKKGNKYEVYYSKDSLRTLEYFVYEITKRDFIVFDFSDSVNVYKDQKPVTVKLVDYSGTITSSLYNALTSGNKSPALALALSEIYAWQIDFWTIQKNDKFRVLYEELFIGDEFFRIGKINAAWFEHRKEKYYAIKFENEKDRGFYDFDGNSLRKAFLKAPVKFSRISSKFSNSRLHPILRIYRPHHGIDYAAPTGTPVVAVGDGTVIKRQRSGGAGKMVKIKHNSTYLSAYLHLSKYAKGLSVGSRVKQGDVIGYVGSTGLSTGPHLDFRFYKNGTPLNYLKMDFPPSVPVSEVHKSEFFELRDSIKNVFLPVDTTIAVSQNVSGIN